MKKLPKYAWGNGVGMSPELWFKRPRKFILKTVKGSFGSRVEHYVPVGDKKSNFFDGGFWIEPKFGIFQSADSVVCLSESREEVMEFTKTAKEILEYPDFWQSGFLKRMKKWMFVKLQK